MEILVVGNYCHDTIVNARGQYEALGGSASYISAVLSRVGIPYEVVAKTGPDFLYRSQVAQAPIVVPDSKTAHFIDDYTNGPRVSTLTAICEPIRPEDLGSRHAHVGMACGVAMELLPETLVRLKELSDIVVCDVQGLIRALGPGNSVILRPLSETPFARVASFIDYLKVSEDEARYVDFGALHARTRVLLTRGSRGCTLMGAEIPVPVDIPAFTAEEIDSSGAGDCFLAGFAAGLVQGLPPELAARQGNWFGSLAVRQIGVPREFTAPPA